MSWNSNKLPQTILIWIGVLILLLLWTTRVYLQYTDEKPVARLILFHSPTCPHCRTVIEEILPPIQEKYGMQFEIRYFNVAQEEGYAAFYWLHEVYPDLPNGVPQGYIHNTVLVGSQHFETHLEDIIDACLAEGGCDWMFEFSLKQEEEIPVNRESTEGMYLPEPVYLAYCYDPTCLECERLTYDLAHLKTNYPNLIIREFNIKQEVNLIEAMCERYGVPEAQRLLVPMIFVGDDFLVKDDITLEKLTSLIRRDGGDFAVQQPWAGLDEADLLNAEGRISHRFSQFNVLAIVFAGLLDGINPCAFTTIIFFVSYLALVGRKGREILFVGFAFTIAVFLTYVLMGMGIAAFVEKIRTFEFIGILIYGFTAIVCFVLAGLSAWDYVKITRGELTEISLQLPQQLKLRIHSTIRKQSRMDRYVWAAFITGVLVSVFELACTGQVYLPTIIFMTSVDEVRLKAFLYLVLYNLMFVVPLLGVFSLAYFGTSNQQFTDFFQNHVKMIKLTTIVLFLGLGIWLSYFVIVS